MSSGPITPTVHTTWRVWVMRVVVNAVAVAFVVLVLPGVKLQGSHTVLDLLLLGAIFGLVNAFIKPAMQFVALPFLFGSMGLVVLIVDVIAFWILDAVAKRIIDVEGALWIIVAGVLLGLVSFLLDNVLGLTPPILSDGKEGTA